MDTVILFLDTEFSDLYPGMEILSLALASLDECFEFYGERNDVPASRCSPFVRRNILPLMTAVPPVSGDLMNLRSRLRTFLEVLPDTRLACDSFFDVMLFSRLLGKPWPRSVNPVRISLSKWKGIPAFENARRTFHAAGHPEHHALNDARGLRAGYQAWQAGHQAPLMKEE